MDDMTEELIDRFGDPPKSVENLLYIAKIKSMAHRLYFTEVAQKGESVRFTLYEKARIDVAKIPELVAAYGQKVTFTADPKNPYFTYHLKKNSRDKNVDIKSVVEQFLADAGKFLAEREAPREGWETGSPASEKLEKSMKNIATRRKLHYNRARLPWQAVMAYTRRNL